MHNHEINDDIAASLTHQYTLYVTPITVAHLVGDLYRAEISSAKFCCEEEEVTDRAVTIHDSNSRLRFKITLFDES